MKYSITSPRLFVLLMLSCSLVSAESPLPYPIDYPQIVFDGDEPGGESAGKTPIAKLVRPPDADEIQQRIKEMGEVDVTLREAAIRRLMPHPKEAGKLIVRVFKEGNLSTRLGTLDLLREWNAPVEEFDPWRPETLTEARFAELEAWAAEIETGAEAPKRAELNDAQRAEVSEEIARMLRVSDEEAEAIRERLARFAEAPLPMVYEQLKYVTNDRERLRLQILRYRLVADESLLRRWPGGLLRLASLETAVRQKAAEELAGAALAEDQSLLRELFSDPNPLVREICLRGMQKIGGDTQEILLDLLADPEPNVRAAVLKQFEENPGPAVARKITEYVKTETDPDLVGHAVRVLKSLREQGDARATRSLMGLLKHDRWQVRAEAATSLSGDMDSISNYGSSNLTARDQLEVDVYVALIECLDDEDSFVVSKAMEGLESMDMSDAVEPFLKSIERYPDLAAHAIRILKNGSKMRSKAAPRLQAFVAHENPRVRVAVISEFSDIEEKMVIAALDDTDGRVRIAAAGALFKLLESKRLAALRTGDADRYSGFATYPSIPQSITISEMEAPKKITDYAMRDPFDEEDESDTEVFVSPFNMPSSPISETETPEAMLEEDTDGNVNFSADFALNSSQISPGAYERWLLEFQGGKSRPEWANEVGEKLEKMLKSDSIEERIAAAVLLVPLGRAEEMAPKLLEMIEEKPEYFPDFVRILPWLPRDKRIEHFRQWRAESDPQPGQIATFLEAMIVPVDFHFEPLLWEILNEDGISFDMVYVIFDQLCDLYQRDKFVYRYETQLPKKQQDELIEKIRKRAESDDENQRFVAVSILLTLDTDKARELAAKYETDESMSEEFRRDMFQIRLLLLKDKKEIAELSVETLKRNDPARSKLVFLKLLGELYRLHVLRGGVYLRFHSSSGSSYTESDRKTPVVPQGIDLEILKPLLAGESDELAAYAGYFTALLGDASGMEPLLTYRRKVDRDGSDAPELLNKMVYRTIASLNDPRYVPVLREIFKTLDEYDVRDFYWTIRVMTGPEVLQLRKEIRAKFGTSNLM